LYAKEYSDQYYKGREQQERRKAHGLVGKPPEAKARCSLNAGDFESGYNEAKCHCELADFSRNLDGVTQPFLLEALAVLLRQPSNRKLDNV
jgi:hypothetical protein